jgi:hypothetical protein
MKSFSNSYLILSSPITYTLKLCRASCFSFSFKDKFTDPIDGKVLKRSCLMAMERKETMSYHQALSLERHRLLWLFLNEESDFFHPL